jgi:hypothetical protein
MTFEQFQILGYKLEKNVFDWMGIKHKLGVYPNGCGGGINYFENLIDLDIWYHQVLWNRAVQSGEYEEAERLNIILISKKCHIGIPELLKQQGLN